MENVISNNSRCRALVLDKRMIQQYLGICNYVKNNWNNTDKKFQSRLANIRGCLDKFATFVFQLSRLISYQEKIIQYCRYMIQSSKNQTGTYSSTAFSAREACSDFESVILQARAALDRLTWFICKELNCNSSSFSNLRKILKNAGKHNELAHSVLALLDKSTWLENIFVNDFNHKHGLRNFVAHYGSIMEEMGMCFAIYRVYPKGFLIYDMESYGIPLFMTAWESSKYIPFVILNSLAIFTTKKVYMHSYPPKWENKTVAISNYKTQHGFSVSAVIKMTPTTFEFNKIYVSRKILNKLLYLSNSQ